MTEIRKLAAILAIDAVSYSRLMGEDEWLPRNGSDLEVRILRADRTISISHSLGGGCR